MTAVATRLECVVRTDAHEGPVYAPAEDALYFTTVRRPDGVPADGHPRVAIKRLALDGTRFPLDASRVSVVRPDANVANGMALAREGRLLVCEQGTRSQHAAITLFDPGTGELETVVDRWAGLPLNSPNDVVEKSDGTIWFTDPSYGHLQGFRPEPQAGDHVYRYDPRSAELSVVAGGFDKPNGLAFSPGETVLYVGDSERRHVKAFDVVGDGERLADERLFCTIEPGFPDGLKVDAEGSVYASSASGVQIFASSGNRLGEIELPGAVNFTFGGPDRNVLFITTDEAIWAAHLDVTGPPTLKGA